MRNRVSICTLIIGLICPFTQVAREPRAAGAVWDDWRKVRRRRRTPFRIGQANATAFRQWRSWLRWGGFERPLGYRGVRTNPFEADYSFVSFICFASSASSILAGTSLGRVQFLKRCGMIA